jgi:hypothetical protein
MLEEYSIANRKDAEYFGHWRKVLDRLSNSINRINQHYISKHSIYTRICLQCEIQNKVLWMNYSCNSTLNLTKLFL